MKGDSLFFGFTAKFWISSLLVSIASWLFLRKIGSMVLLPFGFAAITSYICNTFVENISTKYKTSKSLLAFAIVFAIFFTLITFFILFIPVAVRNLLIISKILPNLIGVLQERLLVYIPEGIHSTIVESYSQIHELLPSIGQKIFTEFSSISSILAQTFSFFVITPIITFYMIKDWKTINSNITSLIPTKHRHAFITIRTEIRLRLAGYITGQINIILFLASFYGIALSIVHLQFGFTIGILTGLASIIPYAGLTCGFIVAILVAFLKGHSFFYICVVGSIFIAGQIIEGSFLTPKLMSDKIQIHPLWIIFGFLVSGIFFGFFGILFALPLTAIASVLIKFYIKNYYKKHYV